MKLRDSCCNSLQQSPASLLYYPTKIKFRQTIRTKLWFYRGADKSLARSGRKQARKHVRDARDFNIDTRIVIKFFFPPARQGGEGNSRHSARNISLFSSWSG